LEEGEVGGDDLLSGPGTAMMKLCDSDRSACFS
jgi:hypothetical protein